MPRRKQRNGRADLGREVRPKELAAHREGEVEQGSRRLALDGWTESTRGGAASLARSLEQDEAEARSGLAARDLAGRRRHGEPRRSKGGPGRRDPARNGDGAHIKDATRDGFLPSEESTER